MLNMFNPSAWNNEPGTRPVKIKSKVLTSKTFFIGILVLYIT